MKYTVLSAQDTEIWLGNVLKTLMVIKKLISSIGAIETNLKKDILNDFHRNAYMKFYSNMFYGLYDADDICIFPSGKAWSLNSACFSDLRYSLTQEQVDARKYLEQIMDDGTITFVSEISHCWNVYADKPFNISEEDIINYTRIMRIHECVKMALKDIGLYDEACNLDEDSRSSS